MRIERVLGGVLVAMLPCLSQAQQDTLKEIDKYCPNIAHDIYPLH